MKRHRRQGSSGEHELSLAAADEVKEWIGCVHIDLYGDGQCVVGMDTEDEGDKEVVLIRALLALGTVARETTGWDGEDA